jgi:hypothetical protein
MCDLGSSFALILSSYLHHELRSKVLCIMLHISAFDDRLAGKTGPQEELMTKQTSKIRKDGPFPSHVAVGLTKSIPKIR